MNDRSYRFSIHPRRVLPISALILFSLIGCAAHRSGPPTARGLPKPSPKRHLCLRTTSVVTIDGRLDEPAWETAPWTDLFVDIEGPTKPRPRLQTRVRMMWDDRNLYIAALLEEPHVWATLTKHDEVIFHENDFEVFVDPDGDSRNYYEIEVNALNAVFDLLLVRTYIDGGPARHDWDLGSLKTAVYVEGTINQPDDVDKGWSIEMALPWVSLAPYAGVPCPPRHGDIWRMNFSRVEWRHEISSGRYSKIPNTPEDNWVWSPQGEINMHIPDRWGYVEFAARTE